MNDDLREAHEARIRALLAGDLEALDRYVDDDLTWTSPHGQLFTKPQVFESFRSGAMTVERMEIDQLAAREYGDTAILTYRARTRYSNHGTTVDGLVRSTATYLRRDGTWKLVAQQQTAILEDAD